MGSHTFAPPIPWCYIYDAGILSTRNIDHLSKINFTIPDVANNYAVDSEIRPTVTIDFYVFYIPLGIALAAALIMYVPKKRNRK